MISEQSIEDLWKLGIEAKALEEATERRLYEIRNVQNGILLSLQNARHGINVSPITARLRERIKDLLADQWAEGYHHYVKSPVLQVTNDRYPL